MPFAISSQPFAVSECFTSIQGEGKLTGARSHFIRLHGCNLRCRWCDTPYASWDAAKEPRAQAQAKGRPAPDTGAARASEADPGGAPTAPLPILHDGARLTGADLIASARASGARHIVITGGEPLIFPGIADLCRAIMAGGFHLTIETAGTVLPRAARGQRTENKEQRIENGERGSRDSDQAPALSDHGFQISDGASTPRAARATKPQLPDARAIGLPSPSVASSLRRSVALPLCSLISLSPKLASSTPLPGDPRDPTGAWRQRHEQRRLNFPAMQALLDSAPDRQIKFVITSPEDLPEIESILDRLTGWQPGDIFLMPEGVTVPDSATVRWITEAAARRGWRYGRRLHIERYGNTRGT